MEDSLIVVLYLFGIFGVGVGLRRIKKLGEFFVAGRKVGPVTCTATLCATIMGGSATVGMAGLGFKLGLPAMWWLLVGSLGLGVLALTLGGKVRRLAPYTLPELAGKLYDGRVRLAASILVLVAWLGVIAGQILATERVLSTLLGWPPGVTAAGAALVFLAYTLLGGQRAVIRTDVLQFGFIVVSLCAVLAPLAVSAAGGLGGLKAQLPPDYFRFPFNQSFGPAEALSFFLLVGLTYLVGPDIYSRLFAAKDERTARVSAFAAGILIIPLALSVVLIGAYARAELVVASPESSIPEAIDTLLGPGLRGLAMAGILAVLMSSADTLLMTTSTIAAWDIYKRHLSPRASEGEVLRVSRVALVIFALSALGLALAVEEVISALLLAYAVFSSGLIIPVIAGFYKRKLGVTPLGALAGLVGGGASALVLMALGISPPNLKAALSLVVCAGLLFGVSWAWPRRSRQALRRRFHSRG